jgi:hypothetical protein
MEVLEEKGKAMTPELAVCPTLRKEGAIVLEVTAMVQSQV